MASVTQKIAVAWQKEFKRCISSSMTRATGTLDDKHSSQILLSPPLVSLDVPEIWNHSSNNEKPPEQKKRGSQTATIIDGKSIAEEIRSGIARDVSRMKEFTGKVPGLGVILVGQRRDSQTYVRNKMKACEETGIKSVLAEMPGDCREDDVISAVSNFNRDPSIHGILVQLPLPEHINEEKILNEVSLDKDVDGFHPENTGNLAMTGKEPLFISCTPKGCVELLIRSGVTIMGKKAVVIGRSNIVGLPASLLLQRHHATVTVVNGLTKNPELVTSEADILLTAVGVPNLVRRDWVKPGAVVIDVGTCPVEDPSAEYGYRLEGDVCFREVVKVASAITPVPGGVGPMTIAMLLSNTLDAAKRALKFT